MAIVEVMARRRLRGGESTRMAGSVVIAAAPWTKKVRCLLARSTLMGGIDRMGAEDGGRAGGVC